MIYVANYKSPIGNLLIASKNNKLIGLWIEGQNITSRILKMKFNN